MRWRQISARRLSKSWQCQQSLELLSRDCVEPLVRGAPFSSRDRIGIYMQILNVFNASTITGTQNRVPSTAIAGIDNPILYGAPGTIIAPRQINIGGRWSF